MDTHPQFEQAIFAKGYTATPNLLLDYYAQLGISGDECLFLVHIWRYWRPNHNPYPSVHTIAEHMGKTVRQVRRYIQSLRSKGYLRIVERSLGDGGRTRNEYDLGPLICAIEDAARSDGIIRTPSPEHQVTQIAESSRVSDKNFIPDRVKNVPDRVKNVPAINKELKDNYDKPRGDEGSVGCARRNASPYGDAPPLTPPENFSKNSEPEVMHQSPASRPGEQIIKSTDTCMTPSAITSKKHAQPQPTTAGYEFLSLFCAETKDIFRGDRRRREALYADDLLRKAGNADEALAYVRWRISSGQSPVLQFCARDYVPGWRQRARPRGYTARELADMALRMAKERQSEQKALGVGEGEHEQGRDDTHLVHSGSSLEQLGIFNRWRYQ